MSRRFSAATNVSRGAQGIDPDMLAQIRHLYGFDQPPVTRFFHMIGNYLRFDFGESFYRNRRVTDLILDKMPVSISLGLWTTLLVYLISIPLGIRKAVKDGTAFDLATSWVIVIAYAIPSFLFAILLIILFAGGSYWNIFPSRGLTSDNFAHLSWAGKAGDYLWHRRLVGHRAGALRLRRAHHADQKQLSRRNPQAIRADRPRQGLIGTARAVWPCLPQRYADRHRRPAGALIKILFTSALLIEVIFSLDGMGLLGFESAVGRDYPVMFGTLYLFTLLGLVLTLVGDILYMLIDPRIDFERREV